ncbi:MAG TPA: DNA oxidative demethylase AlkB [Rhodanobacteraceae bacterium]|nr:DNA oxidative demethylase AlkB [Rhodanobacteraceae bacterium]
MHAATPGLFDANTDPQATRQTLCDGAMLLRGFARVRDHEVLEALDEVIRAAPWRHMLTPGGSRMSVAMSNCGELGWISDRRGYRYTARDPQTDMPWPVMPEVFLRLACDAAAEAGFAGFPPDACLINRYEPGAKMSLHQDRDERDLSQPIVSVSLGLPAMFLFGGERRNDKPMRIPLTHGDVVVWGGKARLRHHGVLPLKAGTHPALGACRINLTLRKAA